MVVGSTEFEGWEVCDDRWAYIRFTNKSLTDMRCEISNKIDKYYDKLEWKILNCDLVVILNLRL